MNEKVSIRTDLALESVQSLYAAQAAEEISGVNMMVETLGKYENITLTTVDITNSDGENLMGKPMGSYVTIESESLRHNEVEVHEEIITILSKSLNGLCKLNDDSMILIVGLGNWNVTPDALGPKVVSKVLVTRHIMDSLPPELNSSSRSVGAISPGVMGLTGIETCEIVKGIAQRVKPSLIIAIDALAARSSGRINSAIQLSDTGINPGSGVNNARMNLNRETLGVPVIGIGVPTVIDAATLVSDTMDMILGSMIDELPEGSEFLTMLENLESREKYSIIRGILEPNTENMFVAPKEVDAVIERLSNIIANSINIALHPGIDISDINRYIY